MLLAREIDQKGLAICGQAGERPPERLFSLSASTQLSTTLQRLRLHHTQIRPSLTMGFTRIAQQLETARMPNRIFQRRRALKLQGQGP